MELTDLKMSADKLGLGVVIKEGVVYEARPCREAGELQFDVASDI